MKIVLTVEDDPNLIADLLKAVDAIGARIQVEPSDIDKRDYSVPVHPRVRCGLLRGNERKRAV